MCLVTQNNISCALLASCYNKGTYSVDQMNCLQLFLVHWTQKNMKSCKWEPTDTAVNVITPREKKWNEEQQQV